MHSQGRDSDGVQVVFRNAIGELEARDDERRRQGWDESEGGSRRRMYD